MLQPLILLAGLLLASPPPASPPPAPAEPFELKDGDRVVFVGGTFIEREGEYGYIESALAARFAGRNITFRNLGQSGDTALADARNLNAGWVTFGPPDQGMTRLKKLIAEIKPTVIIANYGMTESFAGPAKLEEFKANYDQLLTELIKSAGGHPRLVLLSPNYHESLSRKLPDPKEHNQSLALYRDAVRELAAKHQARFVDLYAVTERLCTSAQSDPVTDNGIHPTQAGFARLVAPLLAELGVAPASPGEETAARAEKIRPLVVAKNAEYFHYWRPQNDTYILGYRKKEQGRNAVEMPQFLPIVEAKEKEIAGALGRR